MLALAPHVIWSDQFRYFWVEQEGWWCFFAEYPDGIFMPLPPLGPLGGDGQIFHASLSFEQILRMVFTEMTIRNQGRAVTRIENIPEELKAEFESYGYALAEKYPEYLYRTQDLIELKGDRYKSQRAACNQFSRQFTASVEEFRTSNQGDCLALYDKWADQKRERQRQDGTEQEWLNQVMLDQARLAHRRAMLQEREWGLVGRVIKIDGNLGGYTFGYERNSQVWCILLEVSDRAVPGLAQFLFREYCRQQMGYSLINTMDDSGLVSLARSKLSYHPIRMVKNFIATPGSIF